MAQRDYYDILGVSKTASADEIKKAHRKLVRKYHPDVNKNNDPASTERFKEAQEAYDVLSDDTKRANYDQFGHAGVNAGGPTGGSHAQGDPFEAFRRAQAGARGGRPGRGQPVEDFNFGGGAGGGDFSEIFEQMFGGRRGGAPGGGRGRAQQAPKGNDIEHPVTLEFYQAFTGTTLPLQINRGGKLETIDIKIPPGVKDGSKIRLKGKGESAGGEPGDLYIVVSVRPHEYFQRNGLDIILDVPISMYEALLGAKIEVPTMEGKVTVIIPPGTSSGSKLRIKGRGIKRGDEVGDQYAVLKIIVPKNLDQDEMDIVHNLETKHPIDARKDLKW